MNNIDKNHIKCIIDKSDRYDPNGTYSWGISYAGFCLPFLKSTYLSTARTILRETFDFITESQIINKQKNIKVTVKDYDLKRKICVPHFFIAIESPLSVTNYGGKMRVITI